MSIVIEQLASATHFLATNTLSDIFHFGQIPTGSKMSSGQPIAVYGPDSTALLDLLFTSYTLKDDGNDKPLNVDMDNSTLEEVYWSVYDVEANAQAVADDINSFDFVKITIISNNGQWAVPVQQSIFDAMPAGDAKDRLVAAATLSVSEGRRKTKDEMLASGWA